MNCLNGPEQQLPIALEMRSAVGGFVAAQPVAYRTSAEQPDFTSTPSFPYELDPLQLSRQEMAEYARAREGGRDRLHRLVLRSVQAHVRAMAKAIGKTPDAEREWKSTAGRAMSAYEYYEHTETEV